MIELLAKATVNDIAFNIVGGMIIATMIAVIIYFVKEIYDAYTLHKCKKQVRAKYKVGDAVTLYPDSDCISATVIKITDTGVTLRYKEPLYDTYVETFFEWEFVSRLVK